MLILVSMDGVKIVGKEQIFKSFYLRHFRAVVGFCYSYTKSQPQALDMAQEAFCRLWQNWSHDYTVRNAQAFIYITAKNLCLNHLRHSKFKLEESETVEEELISEQTLLEEIIRQEAIEAVRQAVASLSGRKLQIVRLALEGHTNPEIAEKLGISLNTVKSAKKEAYAILGKYLGNEYLMLLVLEVLEKYSHF